MICLHCTDFQLRIFLVRSFVLSLGTQNVEGVIAATPELLWQASQRDYKRLASQVSVFRKELFFKTGFRLVVFVLKLQPIRLVDRV